jgi:hypothetical protein
MKLWNLKVHYYILSFIFRQTQPQTNQLTHISLCTTELIGHTMFRLMEPSSGDTSPTLHYRIMHSIWIHIFLSLFFDRRYMYRLYCTALKNVLKQVFNLIKGLKTLND